MARYRDPAGPRGRTVFGGTEFVDGVTADIEPGESTLQLFAAAGIVEVPPEPVSPDPAPSEQAEPPASKPRKK